jgi:calcineurin-like phosphoesterase family protein
MIYFSSDYHFNHDREFIYQARGFPNVEEMNEAIIQRHNEIVKPEDIIYVLGDLCLGGGSEEALQKNKELIERLNGTLYIIRGNHDSDNRCKMYRSCKNVKRVTAAMYLNYNGYHFYLSHYPTLTGNLEKESLKQCTINLYGHTHQEKNFYRDIPFMYHVGVDSHDCYPVSVDAAIAEMKAKVQECLNEL